MSAKFWSDGNVRRERADRDYRWRAKHKRSRHRTEPEAALLAEAFAIQEAIRRRQIVR